MATRSADGIDDRPQKEEEKAKDNPHRFYPSEEAEHAYINARLSRLDLSLEKQERDLRQFKLVLIIVVYALVFGYLVGRNDARDSRS